MQNIDKIKFEMNRPCVKLEDYIQTFWFADNIENQSNLEYKILSDAASGIVFNFGDSLTHQYAAGEVIEEEKTITLGPSKELLKLNFTGKVQTIGIRFFPFTGHHFFNTPMNELTNKILKTAPDHFLGRESLYTDLESLLEGGGTRTEVIKLLEDELVRVLELKHSPPQSQLVNLFKAVLLKPEIELEELSIRFNISKRDIQRLFKTYVGVTPKAFLRLNKIRGVKNKIAQDEFSSLTQLSLDSGYFDQAHFIRDFKSFMEDTPKKYHEFKRDLKSEKL